MIRAKASQLLKGWIIRNWVSAAGMARSSEKSPSSNTKSENCMGDAGCAEEVVTSVRHGLSSLAVAAGVTDFSDDFDICFGLFLWALFMPAKNGVSDQPDAPEILRSHI